MKKLSALLFLTTALILGAKAGGFNTQQMVVTGVFSLSILGVIFFWDLRLSFVFFGAGLLLLTHSVDLENLLRFASLDVILFLIGMMILVGILNDAGLFYWLVTFLLRVRELTGHTLFIILMSISAVLSGMMGEVASIIVMARIILDLSEVLEVDPVPLILSSVLATNIGSSGTVLGNPIGVLIAARSGLTFEDFIAHALPITTVVLVLTVLILFLWNRKYMAILDEKLQHLHGNTFFFRLIDIPADRKTIVSTVIFLVTVVCISLHHRFELFFNLEENTLLMIFPIFFAGLAMLYRRDRIRYYVEHEVEWSSVLFFLFLFALAGVMKSSGISDMISRGIITGVGSSVRVVAGVILFSGGLLSSVLDNTVVVASYAPIISSLGSVNADLKPLWWALLFGACYGGNITVIGSTANIVAMDLLEKKKGLRISFLAWLKIGFIIGMTSMLAAYILLLAVYHL